ncbi:MAG TPA: hypothetical protein V6C89_03750 [Drouetiella sp.]|jgi:hypothetical protein
MPEPFNDPAVVAYMLVMPIVIIGLAKMWKRVKDKKAAARAAASSQAQTEST